MPVYLLLFIISWITAQFTKYILELRKNKQARLLSILMESGGMPSSHSAVVVSVATLVGLREGVHSAVFGVAFTLAMIVIYDSLKVRYSTGQQSIAINSLIEETGKNIPRLRVVKGHTILEVACGSALGFLMGVGAFFVAF